MVSNSKPFLSRSAVSVARCHDASSRTSLPLSPLFARFLSIVTLDGCERHRFLLTARRMASLASRAAYALPSDRPHFAQKAAFGRW